MLGVAAMVPARAHHLLAQHAIDCSANFPCPESIQPRVRFWIEVFRSWSQKTAILHDPNQPQRVYAVFDTGQGCSRAVRGAVNAKRKQIKTGLYNLAARIDAKQPPSGEVERHLAALFPSNNARRMRAAAENIRCQSGVRDSFVAGLARYNRYRAMVDAVLAESGLPPEIRYLPFVESSYNPAAYSKAGAAGMWQIMPKTARVLGLELNATIDERLDPEAATRAAAKYLLRADRDLTAIAKQFAPSIARAEINPFVITSYNYGVNGMKRAIRKIEPDFMQVLERYKSPRFQIAVKNFYASFLAARHVAINAEEYFGAIAAERADDEQTVVLTHATSIARIKAVFGLDEAQLRARNRALTRYVWRGWRQIPAGYR
ncbi:MAG: lytic transglycosylase domain-containing protein, partial [bacterium]